MSIPHDSWAELYDEVYERSFGSLYTDLTDITLSVIRDCLPPPAKLVDFGAGTGRLSLPLVEMGYEVTAVEPSKAMLGQLEKKRAAKHPSVDDQRLTSTCCPMDAFPGDGQYDGALCVFTVILYLLGEEALLRSFRAAAAALRRNGLMLLDVPGQVLFSGGRFREDGIDRHIEITRKAGALFHYEESTTLETETGSVDYRDAFPIRYWTEEEVSSALTAAGFSIEEDLSDQFSGSGSCYWLVRRR